MASKATVKLESQHNAQIKMLSFKAIKPTQKKREQGRCVHMWKIENLDEDLCRLKLETLFFAEPYSKNSVVASDLSFGVLPA